MRYLPLAGIAVIARIDLRRSRRFRGNLQLSSDNGQPQPAHMVIATFQSGPELLEVKGKALANVGFRRNNRRCHLAKAHHVRVGDKVRVDNGTSAKATNPVWVQKRLQQEVRLTEVLGRHQREMSVLVIFGKLVRVGRMQQSAKHIWRESDRNGRDFRNHANVRRIEPSVLAQECHAVLKEHFVVHDAPAVLRVEEETKMHIALDDLPQSFWRFKIALDHVTAFIDALREIVGKIGQVLQHPARFHDRIMFHDRIKKKRRNEWRGNRVRGKKRGHGVLVH